MWIFLAIHFVCLSFVLEIVREFANVKWGGSVTKYDQIGLSTHSVLSKGFSHCSPILTASPNLAPNLSPFFVPTRQLSSRRPRRCRPPCKLSQLTSCRHINDPPSLVSSTGTPPCCLRPQLGPESANVPISTRSPTRKYKKSTQMVDSEKSSLSKTLLHPPQLLLQPPPARTAILHHINLQLILLR